MQAESHMIADGMMVVQSGSGTLQFPVEEVDRIMGTPADMEARAAQVRALKTISTNAVPSADEVLVRAAVLMGLQPEFVRSVAMVESGLRQDALSPKGAVGLMQLMPLTAGQMGLDAHRADENAMGGAAFLRQLLFKYKGDSVLALAAYNAGPGAVDKYKGVPPFAETQHYVTRVLQEYARQRIQTEKDPQVVKAKTSDQGGVQIDQSLRAERIGSNGDAVAVRR